MAILLLRLAGLLYVYMSNLSAICHIVFFLRHYKQVNLECVFRILLWKLTLSKKCLFEILLFQWNKCDGRNENVAEGIWGVLPITCTYF